MLSIKNSFLIILLSILVQFVTCQDRIKPSTFDYFNSEEVLHISLGFDLKSFIDNKNNPENFDALITIYGKSDTLMEFVNIKARGNMRRSYCSFPPLTIKFKKAPDIKVVTHCRNSDIHTSYLFREYLAYKLYNQLTPYSFKTRLVKIDYVDTKKQGHVISEYGFLIENEDKMAERNLAMVIDNDNISQRHMQSLDMTRLALFNYMIGNTDWSVLSQHNVKILRPVNEFTDEGIPVAYDFDYSGFVSTAYAAPSKDLPIKTTAERYYQGNCINPVELQTVIEEFEVLQPTFVKTIRDFELLPDNARKKLEYYVDGFYKSYRNQNVLISELNKTCRRTE